MGSLGFTAQGLGGPAEAFHSAGGETPQEGPLYHSAVNISKQILALSTFRFNNSISMR